MVSSFSVFTIGRIAWLSLNSEVEQARGHLHHDSLCLRQHRPGHHANVCHLLRRNHEGRQPSERKILMISFKELGKNQEAKKF